MAAPNFLAHLDTQLAELEAAGLYKHERVIDSPQSIVYDIAENRLHVQKAILVLLMGGS